MDLRFDKKQTDRLFYLSLFMLAILAFVFLGSREPAFSDDSFTYMAYMQIKDAEGVMPLYPLFLFLNRLIFGNRIYLTAVVAEQTVAAIVCVIYFVRALKIKFGLSYRMAYLAYFLTIIPFTTDFPEAMVPQEILTEGLTYALFYPFILLLAGAVWNKSWKKLAEAFAFLVPLALLRSQLQILFALCGMAALYTGWVKHPRRNKAAAVCRVFLCVLLCLFVTGAGLFCTVKVNSAVRRMLFGDGSVAEFVYIQEKNIWYPTEFDTIREVQTLEEHESAADGNASGQNAEIEAAESGTAEPQDDVSKEDKPAPNTAPEVLAFLESGDVNDRASVSQYSSILFSKGMYEADYEDYLLFEDEEVQAQFLYVYDIVDGLKYRYPYGESGLWGWRHIANSVGGIGTRCFDGLNDYFADYYNTTIVNFQYQCTAEAFWVIGKRLLTQHFGSFVAHSLKLMVPSFIYTVFFQKENLYLLCHLITLFVYVSAAALMLWCFWRKGTDKRLAEFMLLILANNVIMVTAVSLLFVGLQRYLVYAFGIFYISYFLLIREFWEKRKR